MNFQEENPADKEAEEKEVNASQRGSRGEENTIKGITGRTHGQGIPCVGEGSVFASKAHGGIAGQWPEHKLSNPNCSVRRGLSLLSESEGGRNSEGSGPGARQLFSPR